jgi:hypothetical protein
MSRSQRLAEWLLSTLLPLQCRDALIGDLREEASAATATRIQFLYWREVAVALAGAIKRTLVQAIEEDLMTVIGTATRRPVAFALALGVLGGGALIVTTWITSRGQMIFLPYVAIVLASVFFRRTEAVTPLSRRFALSLGAFMLATLILYVFIAAVAVPKAARARSLADARRPVSTCCAQPANGLSTPANVAIRPRPPLEKISILGHAWRIGFMLLIGSILSAAVAQLTGTTTRTPESSLPAM